VTLNNRRLITADQIRANIARHKEEHRRRAYEAQLAVDFWAWSMDWLSPPRLDSGVFAWEAQDCGCANQA
jgi:hypothetical protein